MYVRGNVPGGSFGGLAGVWGFGQESLDQMESRLAERGQANLTDSAGAASLSDKDVLRKLALLHSRYPQQRYHIEKVYELISSQKIFQ